MQIPKLRKATLLGRPLRLLVLPAMVELLCTPRIRPLQSLWAIPCYPTSPVLTSLLLRVSTPDAWRSSCDSSGLTRLPRVMAFPAIPSGDRMTPEAARLEGNQVKNSTVFQAR
jgi:hypothetical protein